jgi:hypothetical protein
MLRNRFACGLFTTFRLGFCRGIQLCTQGAGFKPQSNFLLAKPVETGGIAAGF